MLLQIETIINKYIYTKVAIASLLAILYNLIVLLNYFVNIILFLLILIEQYTNRLQDICINIKILFSN